MDIMYFNDDLKDFIERLPPDVRKKTAKTIALLASCGHLLRMPYSRPLKNGIFELRTHGHWEVRIFYVFHRKMAVLLHACIKKTNATPKTDLEIAADRSRHLDEI